MASLTVVVSAVQAVVFGSRFGQSLTKITYSFPQAGHSEACLSHIGRLEQEGCTELRNVVVSVVADGILCIIGHCGNVPRFGGFVSKTMI